MAAKKIDLGGTGETVKENVKRLRGGMQYKELSERLAELGRPIPPLGLRRIEAGERRVDVDDLMALAVAFDVSPLALLLPRDGSRELASPMAGVVGREVAHNTQWLFALAQEPLAFNPQDNQLGAKLRKFQLRSKPTVDERDISSPEITELTRRRFELMDAGKTREEISDELGESINRAQEIAQHLALIQGMLYPESSDGND